MNFPFETNGKLMILGVPILKHFKVDATFVASDLGLHCLPKSFTIMQTAKTEISVSSLVYPFTLYGRCATSDHDFATNPFHLVLSSAALAELAKSIPVHS